MHKPSLPPENLSAETIIDTMAEGVVLLNADGVITRWNPAMARITGFDANQALGRPYTWMQCPDNSCYSIETMLKQDEDHERDLCLCESQCLLQGPNGERIPVLVNVQPVHRQGRLLAILLTFTDFRAMEGLTRELSELERQAPGETHFHGIIGKDKIMREVFRLLELAADSDVTVLLQGESGTGKELAAQAIADLSHRHGAPFVKVNCGALTETILESELFGHVKGAFTGAYRDRIGRFEAADGGTLFLDEIADITPMLQVKLLRVLQEHEFERVGDSVTRRADVRVIAASNRDLTTRVRQGEFREDLYYRLRVFPITMPPLRERIDDVPLLVRHFIQKFRKSTGKPIEELDHEAMRAVMDYCWPGNVRELENAIEHAFVTCQTTAIGLFDLPQELRQFELRRSICADRRVADLNQQTAAPDTRDRIARDPGFEHNYFIAERSQHQPTRDRLARDPEQLRAMLEECNWNKAEDGRRLGLSRTAVWKWMKKHQIPLQKPAEQ
ncbi:MAG: sigma-54 interaction domain-containing protein [Verrucomicrobiota bacterium]